MNDNQADIVIRLACANDIPRIRDIAAQAWAPVYRGYRERMGEELYELEMPGDRLSLKGDEVSNFCEEQPDWCLVTEHNGQVVGFITFVLHRDKRIGEIGNNAVDPDCQGQGVGTAQCQRVLKIFREAGMKYAKVHTGLDPTHAPARAMYEKVGFKQMIPHVEYYREL